MATPSPVTTPGRDRAALAAQLRSRLGSLLTQRGRPLVVAHRGTPLGMFADNTIAALETAVLSGADVVEVDVIRSRDGEFFLFHDGQELEDFGEDLDLRELSAEQLEALDFRWRRFPGSGLARLADLATTRSRPWLNVDRSWDLWPELLDALVDLGLAERVILKSRPQHPGRELLAAHPFPFLYVPMVRTHEELALAEATDGLTVIGAELLAEHEQDDFAQPEAVAAVRARHDVVLLNAEALPGGERLFRGWDDVASVLQGPEHGWDLLVEIGATMIQTDLPHLLRARLEETKPSGFPFPSGAGRRTVDS